MTKHKLDKEVEDVLKHYGIAGMKWGVRRTDEQIAAAEDGAAAGGGGDFGEEIENAFDNFDDKLAEFFEDFDDKISGVFKNFDKKMGGISNAIKNKGKSLLTKMFGKSETKYSKANPDAKTTKGFKDAMKAYDKASPSQRKALKNGYTIRAESSTKSGGSNTNFKTKSGNSYSGKTVSDKEYKSLMKKLEKQGMKKSTISKGKRVKNKDGSVTQRIGNNTYKIKVESKK